LFSVSRHDWIGENNTSTKPAFPGLPHGKPALFFSLFPFFPSSKNPSKLSDGGPECLIRPTSLRPFIPVGKRAFGPMPTYNIILLSFYRFIVFLSNFQCQGS